MLPEFTYEGLLPPGIHQATVAEFKERFAVMIRDVTRLQVTMEQMERLIRALDDLKENILPKDPEAAAMAKAHAGGDLQRLRSEVSGFVQELAATA